ncbi:type III secretion system protein [Pseudomonas sp. F3-2]|uniref:type III secretion system protein n=1 Tax=Pseudomonas sp. F3-2 TaxID=3141539 RepID=UPI00315C7BB4
MTALRLRKVDDLVARVSRQLGAGASLMFSARGLQGQLTLTALPPHASAHRTLTGFDSAVGRLHLSDAEAMLSLMGELPVTLSGEHQAWYWDLLNQRLSPALAELFCPLQPLSDNTVLPVGDAPEKTVTCRLQLTLGEQTLDGLLCADAAVIQRLLDGRGWHRHRQALADDWPIVQPLELGQLSLTLEQLASLQPGDVLLPLHSHFDSEGHGRLELAGRQWAVQTDSHEHQLYVRLSHEETLGHGQ